MTPHPTPFLGLDPELCDLATASVVVVPYGYEGGISYGRGTAAAPSAVIKASQYLECYDEVLDSEPCRVVLTGELVTGYTREAVIAAVARLFQTSAGALIELFDGRPHAVDEALSVDDAMALQRQLEAMGAHARVDTEPGDVPVFSGLRRPVDDIEHTAGIMHCPACGHRQLVATHCDECGIAFADFAARTTTPWTYL